jgi:hypothetical protein
VLSVCIALPAVVAEVLPFGLKIEKLLDLSVELSAVEQSPTGELWLLERDTGTIRVLLGGEERASLVLPVSTVCDSGLLDVAFSVDFDRTGRAFVSYVESSGRLVVEEVLQRGGSLGRGATVVEVENISGCRPGGALVVGPTGRLYVGVGDMELPSTAQQPDELRGKVLRFESDGSIPADNPDPASPVFASGFRELTDATLHPSSGLPDGTLYVIDRGADGSAADEINVVTVGGNFGWDFVSGDSAGLFDDPLSSYPATIAPRSVAVVHRPGLGPSHQDSLVYGVTGPDELRQLPLVGPALASADEWRLFFDPDGDRDGTPDPLCPTGNDVVSQIGDGLLYTANSGANPGLWRVWDDRPGPREVSPPGSPFSLWLERAGGTELRITWERLDPLDVGRPARNGGQRVENYQIWQGSLPIASGYDHQPLVAAGGTSSGPRRLSQTFTPGAGSHYYLVSAQGDNLEGSTGTASSGTARDPAPIDYCSTIGYGNQPGQCIDDFRHPTTGEPIKLIDYNPLSPTYTQALSIRDFRGKVVHLDIAAFDCFWCQLQAPTLPPVDRQFRDRDFILLTVLNASEFSPRPYTDPAACAAGIAAWVDLHGETTPVLCDLDLDGNGDGDVTQQMWHAQFDDEPCGGFSQNFLIDQGGVIFDFICSFVSGDEVATSIAAEVNAETCE